MTTDIALLYRDRRKRVTPACEPINKYNDPYRVRLIHQRNLNILLGSAQWLHWIATTILQRLLRDSIEETCQKYIHHRRLKATSVGERRCASIDMRKRTLILVDKILGERELEKSLTMRDMIETIAFSDMNTTE